MALDYDRLKQRVFADVRQDYAARDTMLYALSLGIGSDPLDERQLRYVYEQDLHALPTMATVLGSPGFWQVDADTGIDSTRVVHAEIFVTLTRPLAASGDVLGRTKVTAIIDKGSDKGALVEVERTITDNASGDELARVYSTSFCRGDGGFGDHGDTTRTLASVPERPANHWHETQTLPQAALMYRLNGDYNRLHADPATARRAGFERPLLHGLCTFGIAVYAVMETFELDNVGAMGARFTAPVFPGDTLRTEMWEENDAILFRCHASNRSLMVLDRGVVQR